MNEKAYLVLPINSNVGYGKPGYRDWAFDLADDEGMPGPGGIRRHGAVDWFAEANESVRAARGGKVVEVIPSRGQTGQVFGGVVKVLEPGGRVWVYRHIVPCVKQGSSVKPGQVIGSVVNWLDGPDHLHMEVWKSLAGGYNFSNSVNPKLFTYTSKFGRPTLAERLRKAGLGSKSIKQFMAWRNRKRV